MYALSPYASTTKVAFTNATWQETLQSIINYGNQGLQGAQTGLNIATGNTVVEGELGGGHGSYTGTSGVNRDESKILGVPTPYFIGGVIFVGIVGLFTYSLIKK